MAITKQRRVARNFTPNIRYLFTMGNSSSTDIPAHYKRIVLQAPAKELEDAKIVVETVDMCKPKSGEVLIKVTAAPVNPSDYGKDIEASQMLAHNMYPLR